MTEEQTLFGKSIADLAKEQPEQENSLADQLPQGIDPKILDGLSDMEKALVIGIANSEHDDAKYTVANSFCYDVDEENEYVAGGLGAICYDVMKEHRTEIVKDFDIMNFPPPGRPRTGRKIPLHFWQNQYFFNSSSGFNPLSSILYSAS